MGPQCATPPRRLRLQRSVRTLTVGSSGVVTQEGDGSASRDLSALQRAARIAGPPG